MIEIIHTTAHSQLTAYARLAASFEIFAKTLNFSFHSNSVKVELPFMGKCDANNYCSEPL